MRAKLSFLFAASNVACGVVVGIGDLPGPDGSSVMDAAGDAGDADSPAPDSPPPDAGPCYPPPMDLVSWWPADGTPVDHSAIASLTEGMPLYGTGEVLQGFDFGPSGFSGCPDTLTFPTMQFQQMTIEAWVKVRSYPQGTAATIVSYDPINAPMPTGWGLRIDNVGHVSFWVGAESATASMTTVPLGSFVHVAGVFYGAPQNGMGSLTVYQNGSSVGLELAAQQSTPIVASPRLRVGASAAKDADIFNGIVDELTVYRRALDTSEIVQIYYAGAAGKCK